nr:MAG TPA: hypothetical protein [Bacteriophage sp.]
MSFGARVWGPTGLLELDETSFTVRVIYSGFAKTTGTNKDVTFDTPTVNITIRLFE